MKKWQKITLKIVLALCLITVSLICGFVFGWLSGTKDTFYMSSLKDGITTVSVLRDIRNGKNEDAIKLLEITLDKDIVEHSSSKTYHILGLFPILPNWGAPMMSTIAKYRKEYPTQITDATVKKKIEKILASYEISTT